MREGAEKNGDRGVLLEIRDHLASQNRKIAGIERQLGLLGGRDEIRKGAALEKTEREARYKRGGAYAAKVLAKMK